MAELPALESSDFDAFFTAIHGYPPFPWQRRLAAHVAGTGQWPEVLDLPTGSGKTAAIDVAVFQLALEAGQARRRAPLRIVYVVDRRTIVDQAHQRADKIRKAIDAATDDDAHPVLAAVRQRLASYGWEKSPLRTALLRGGIARSDQWARSPDQPLVAVSTVDQAGSRLLFRGYGVSDAMKPVHAGLLGNDVLYLLDEVHLSEPFRQTLAAIVERYGSGRALEEEARWAERPLESPFEVVEMSATPGRISEEAFRLGAEDEEHPVLAKRLGAKKLTTLDSANARGFIREIEKHAKIMVQEPGATVAVVVNRVASARALHEHLSAVLKDAEVHLVTGRMRPLDRDRLEHELFPRIRAGRTRDPEQAPVVVVATQCIEAGADFDFDALITECASLDALWQRFGRLDRLGDSLVGARAVVVARTDSLDDDPVYGKALGNTWRWLENQSAAHEGELDFGIGGLQVPDDPEEAKQLLAPRADAPTLLPAHLDAWVQTSPRPNPDPDIALWLHGPERGVADVQLVWRADLNEDLLQQALADEEARAVALGAVQALTPASGEAMSVPFFAVKRWLDGRSEPDVSDVEGARNLTEDNRGKERDRPARPAIAWRGEASELVSAESLRPGETIVVPASYGGIASGTWAPAASEPVVDLAELAVLRQRARAVLRIHPTVVEGLFGASAPEVRAPRPLDSEDLDDRGEVMEWLANVATDGLGTDAKRLLDALRNGKRALRVERLPTGNEGGLAEYFVVSGRDRVRFDDDEVSSEDDRASFTGVEVTLDAHLDGVREIAGEFADRVGLSPGVAADVRLAARWHDVGKIDPRFQRLMNGGSEFKALVRAEPIAKSAVPMNDWRARKRAQERSGYPPHTRHEVMSLALMASAGEALASRANDWELVQHLVASHHGRCRPFVPWAPDSDPVEMGWELDELAVSASSAHELARLDSGVAERFWRLVRRYGWWGLAWLEAVLRLGDHRRSEEEQRARGGRA